MDATKIPMAVNGSLYAFLNIALIYAFGGAYLMLDNHPTLDRLNIGTGDTDKQPTHRHTQAQITMTNTNIHTNTLKDFADPSQ